MGQRYHIGAGERGGREGVRGRGEWRGGCEGEGGVEGRV